MSWVNGVDYSTGQLISATIWNNYLGAAGDIDLTAPGVVTTAGDTVYATGDNTLARLAIGNAGTVMSSTGSAVQWGLTLTNSITAGSTQTQAGATALTTMANRVTVSGTNGDGVKLPTAVAGLEILVINDDSAQTISVWPNTSDAIDGGSANAVDANALEAGSSRRYLAIDGTNWYTASAPAGGKLAQVGTFDSITAEVSTSSTSYVDVTNLAVTLTTTGGDLVAWLSLGGCEISGSAMLSALQLDSATEVDDKASQPIGVVEEVSHVYRWTSVSSASHTIKARIKQTNGAQTAYVCRSDQSSSTLLVMEVT